MAYYLAFTSGSEYVDIPSPISVSGDGVLAEIDFEYKGASNDVICGGTSFSDFWRINNDNQFRISIAGTANNVNLLSPLVAGTRYMLKLVRTGSSIEVRDSSDTPITPSVTLSTSPFVVGKIGSFHNGSSNLTMDLYGFKAGAETYDPSLSNGTGSTLPTVSGSNQGVLTNFPTDDSQWVFYSAPSTGAEADIAYTVSSPTFSGSASASLPQPVSDIAYTVSAPSFSVAADASLPNPVANVNVTVNAPLFSVAASATSPNINASANLSVSAPEFSATASATLPNPVSDVSFVIGSPEFSVSADSTLPQPVADIAFNQGKPSFSVSASLTITGNVATCLIDLEAPQFSASAKATFPQPECEIDFTTSTPTFSVVAFAGGNAIIKVEGKTIELPCRSRAVYITEG